MAAYERVTLNRGGRNSRFDCTYIGVTEGKFEILPPIGAEKSETEIFIGEKKMNKYRD